MLYDISPTLKKHRVDAAHMSIMSRSSRGIAVACGHAHGTCKRNWASLLRDSESAAPFSLPGRCSARIVNWKWAVKKARHLMRCIASSSLLRPVLTIFTTAALSVRHRTVLPSTAQSGPTMRMPSLSAAILYHGSWNHAPVSVNAPQPQRPEASDVTLSRGRARELPPIILHWVRNVAHHSRSERKPTFRRIYMHI